MRRAETDIAVGNDVVDLRAAGPVHPRFDARVFAASEREALAESPEPESLRWRLWAAKEAAFKALKQLHPELVWSPARFVVAGEQVRHEAGACGLVLERAAGLVHAVATTGPAELVSGWERASADADPSAAVRALARTRLAAALGREIAFEREARIPRLLVDGRRAEASLSFSHHGRFVAFACRLPASLRSAA